MLHSYRLRRDQNLNKGSDAIAKLMLHLDSYQKPLMTPIFGGCPVINLSVEVDDTNPQINRLVRKEINESLNSFIRIIEKGRADGEFLETIDAEQFAYKMFSAISGALIFCRVKNSQTPMKAVIASLKNELLSYTVSPLKN